MNSTETSSSNGKNDRRIVNNTMRLVSYQGNSRKTYHIPPRGSIVLDEIEIRDLPMIRKLVSRGVIEIQDMKKTAKSMSTSARDAKESAAASSTASGGKTRKASPKSKRA
jgi:hypothetical protein